MRNLTEQELKDFVTQARSAADDVVEGLGDDVDYEPDELRVDMMVNYIMDEADVTEEAAHDIINHFSS